MRLCFVPRPVRLFLSPAVFMLVNERRSHAEHVDILPALKDGDSVLFGLRAENCAVRCAGRRTRVTPVRAALPGSLAPCGFRAWA